MNRLNKNVFYKDENIASITVKIYIVYKVIQSGKLYMLFVKNLSIKDLFNHIDIFFPFIIDYLTFIIFLAIIWFKSKKISKQLLPKIESTVLRKSHIVYIAVYIAALDFAINIVRLIILMI
jgi:hypothetical protein